MKIRQSQRGWFSRGLIVGQLALVLVLLAGAGLMVRSVIGLLRMKLYGTTEEFVAAQKAAK